MKRTVLYTLLGLLTLSSCREEEAPIVPSGNYSVMRFDFPQGNNPFDDDIVEIHDIYNTYVIYKDITPQDLNRQWQGLGTGKLKACDPVNVEDMPFYVDFLKNHVFSFMSVDAVRMSMPVKIYCVQNLRDVELDEDDDKDDDDDTSSSGSGGTGIVTVASPVSVKTDGFDYWALSFTPESVSNKDADAMRFARCKFLYVILKTCYVNGVIEEDLSIRNKITWKNPDGTYRAFVEDRRKDDYPYNRGIPDRIVETDFTEVFPLYITEWMKEFGAYSVKNDWFLNYMRLAMFYGRDYVEKKYARYPLVLEIYNDIVELMLTKYGIDLEGVYNGPQTQE